MITFKKELFTEYSVEMADQKGDCHLGNLLFFIAGTIGIATKNGYTYGFHKWNNQIFFVNPLPAKEEKEYQPINIPWGFNGFDIPDNSSIFGWLQTEKYFAHCEDLIRHYFTLKEITKPIKDTIFVHYRNYGKEVYNIFIPLGRDYYMKALEQLPKKRVIVVTDNIAKARSVIGENFEYISNTPIVDFYLLANADYVVMSNSTFSWWGAWLSKAVTVFPSQFFNPTLGNDSADMYCDRWIKV